MARLKEYKLYRFYAFVQLRFLGLWSPSYFAGSCGGATIDIIKQYIHQQSMQH
jgi:REP element-mobilizing transposase RayT